MPCAFAARVQIEELFVDNLSTKPERERFTLCSSLVLPRETSPHAHTHASTPARTHPHLHTHAPAHKRARTTAYRRNNWSKRPAVALKRSKGASLGVLSTLAPVRGAGRPEVSAGHVRCSQAMPGSGSRRLTQSSGRNGEGCSSQGHGSTPRAYPQFSHGRVCRGQLYARPFPLL